MTRAEQIATLRLSIRRSGLSQVQYARTVLLRDPRTLRRWLSGKQHIPRVVLDGLTRSGGQRTRAYEAIVERHALRAIQEGQHCGVGFVAYP